MEQKKIYLTLLNGTGYVFNIDDYMELRKKHHIVGAAVGSSNTRGLSTNDCKLPVELTLCETRLLLEQGIAVLLSKKQSLLGTPSGSELAAYQQRQQAILAEQAEVLKAEKLLETERHMDKILVGKRKKLLAEGVPAEDIHLEAAEVLQEVTDSFVFERRNALLEIPYYHLEGHMGQVVELPPDNSLKYRVFRELWLRGSYITAGDTFGADFLVYPGDPLLYHASHIVILMTEPSMPALSLITKVRGSVIVNKACVFAYFVGSDGEGDEKRMVHYQTVHWESDDQGQNKENGESDEDVCEPGDEECVDKDAESTDDYDQSGSDEDKSGSDDDGCGSDDDKCERDEDKSGSVDDNCERDEEKSGSVDDRCGSDEDKSGSVEERCDCEENECAVAAECKNVDLDGLTQS